MANGFHYQSLILSPAFGYGPYMALKYDAAPEISMAEHAQANFPVKARIFSGG